jgi:hypothetical protein
VASWRSRAVGAVVGAAFFAAHALKTSELMMAKTNKVQRCLCFILITPFSAF